MFLRAFRCPGCQGYPEPESFPLCRVCLDSLIPCPPLCPRCAEPACPTAVKSGQSCLHSWLAPPPELHIQSFHAAYILLGHGYRVLKRWKTGQGPLFDRRVLKPARGIESRSITGLLRVAHQIDLIVPVPQSIARAWRLGCSPAAKIANWSASLLQANGQRVSVLRVLENVPGERQKRQAELSLSGRIENSVVFRPVGPSDRLKNARILVVDDFFTTGKTIRAAAFALRSEGAAEIRTLCLGVRPAIRTKNQEESAKYGANAIATCSAALAGP